MVSLQYSLYLSSLVLLFSSQCTTRWRRLCCASNTKNCRADSEPIGAGIFQLLLVISYHNRNHVSYRKKFQR
jgi:hypothetical protein